MRLLESIFEGLLWNSRLIVIFAVVASLATCFAMFYIATVDAWLLLTHLGEYASPELSLSARADMRATIVTHVIEIIDGYLLATVMLIFSLGLYELFISKIEQAAGSEAASSILNITSLDDLKARLAKVILMILIVKFFERALEMDFANAMEMLQFAGGIALVGLALYLTHAAEHGNQKKAPGKDKNANPH